MREVQEALFVVEDLSCFIYDECLCTIVGNYLNASKNKDIIKNSNENNNNYECMDECTIFYSAQFANQVVLEALRISNLNFKAPS